MKLSKSKVYVETSVISYLAARLSRDLVIAAKQQVTQEWWTMRRHFFECFSSAVVHDESAAGDPEAAKRRLFLLKDLKVLEISDDVLRFAKSLIVSGIIPKKASEDATHVAFATVNRMDFLLTWNCAHIANAEIRRSLGQFAEKQGFESPIICTPEELMGGHS